MANQNTTKKEVEKKDVKKTVKKADTKPAAKSTKKTTKKVEPKKTTKKATPKKTTKKAEVKKDTKKVETKSATKKTTTKKVEVKESTPKKAEAKAVKKQPKKVEKKEEKKTNAIIDMKNSKYTIFLILIIVVCLLLITNIVLLYKGNKAEIVNGSDIIISLDGKKITADEYFEQLKESDGISQLVLMVDEYIVDKELSDDDIDAVTKESKKIIEDLKTELSEYSMDFNDYIKQYYNLNTEEEMLELVTLSKKQEKVLDNYLIANLSEEEIQKYYDETIFDAYDAKHILIKPETNEDMSDDEIEEAEKDAKELAEKVIDKLDDGKAWADLVEKYSDDAGSVENEGLIENFSKTDVVEEFYNATSELEDGKYTSEPVKSTYGYHVILRVKNNGKSSFEDLRETLIDEIIANKKNNDSNIYTTVFVEIRKKYNLEINDSELEKSYNETIEG